MVVVEQCERCSSSSSVKGVKVAVIVNEIIDIKSSYVAL